MSNTPRTVKQQARALARAEGIPYTEARRRILAGFDPATRASLSDDDPLYEGVVAGERRPVFHHPEDIPGMTPGVEPLDLPEGARQFQIEERHDVSGDDQQLIRRLGKLGRTAPVSDPRVMMREVLEEMERLGLDAEHRANYEAMREYLVRTGPGLGFTDRQPAAEAVLTAIARRGRGEEDSDEEVTRRVSEALAWLIDGPGSAHRSERRDQEAGEA